MMTINCVNARRIHAALPISMISSLLAVLVSNREEEAEALLVQGRLMTFLDRVLVIRGQQVGGGVGPISGGEGGCAVDIDGPGTFIGTFQPWGHEDTPAAEAQLLSKRRRDPSSAPLSLSSTFSAPGERLVFRGKFVPDLETSVLHPPSSTLAPLPAKTRSSSLEVGSNSVLHDELATQTTIAQPAISKGAGVSKESRAPGGSHILWLNRDSDEDLPLKARDPEAQVGGPGGPGG